MTDIDHAHYSGRIYAMLFPLTLALGPFLNHRLSLQYPGDEDHEPTIWL